MPCKKAGEMTSGSSARGSDSRGEQFRRGCLKPSCRKGTAHSHIIANICGKSALFGEKAAYRATTVASPLRCV